MLPNTMSTNIFPLQAQSLRMSSMQIAELTGKEHKHVMRDIDVLLADESLSPNLGDLNLIIETRERQTKRGATRYFDLNEDAALLLVSGYNVRLRAAIIAEWRRLRELVAHRLLDSAIREELRLEFRPMTDALLWSRTQQGKETQHYHYSREADLL